MSKHRLAVENAAQKDWEKKLLENLTDSNFFKVACTYLGIHRPAGVTKVASAESSRTAQSQSCLPYNLTGKKLEYSI